MKRCRFCARRIAVESIVCKYCGRDLVGSLATDLLLHMPSEPRPQATPTAEPQPVAVARPVQSRRDPVVPVVRKPDELTEVRTEVKVWVVPTASIK